MSFQIQIELEEVPLFKNEAGYGAFEFHGTAYVDVDVSRAGVEDATLSSADIRADRYNYTTKKWETSTIEIKPDHQLYDLVSRAVFDRYNDEINSKALEEFTGQGGRLWTERELYA